MLAMKTLLAILRLVRFPLLFTALADASVIVLLRHGGLFDWSALGPVWLSAAGLYVFGMAGNDLLDARRDRLAGQAGHGGRVNPVAAGQLSPTLAATIALTAAVVALMAAILSPAVNIWIVLAVLGMALLYNGGAKKFPPVGLLLLGLIRAGNAAQGLTGSAMTEWWFVPGLLGMHVLIVSAFAYAWEGKKPPLYGNNWFHLMWLTALTLAGVEMIRKHLGASPWPTGEAWVVALAWLGFVALFVAIFLKVPRAQRGGLLVYVGLSWLVVLDGAFLLAAGHGQAVWLYGLLLGAVLLSGRMLRRLSSPRAAQRAPSGKRPSGRNRRRRR
jgi:hypothetical protein